MEEFKLEKHAEVLLKELYETHYPHEIGHTYLRSDVIKGLTADEYNELDRFLTTETGLCDKEPRDSVWIIWLSRLGIHVMNEHGSYANYKIHLRKEEEKRIKKESREKWNYIWAIIAGVASVIAIILTVIQLLVRTPLFDSSDTPENTQENTQ